MSNFITEDFLNTVWFDYSKTRLHTTTSKHLYLKIINDICDFLECDFFNINCNQAYSYYSHLKTKNFTLSTLDQKIRMLKSLGNFLEDKASLYGYPNYQSPYRALPLANTETHYIPEEIPSIHIINDMLAYAETHHLVNVFLAITLSFRCALSISDLIVICNHHFTFKDLITLDIYGPTPRTIKIPDDVIECIKRTDLLFFNSEAQVSLFRKNKSIHAITIRTLQNQVQKVANAIDCTYSLRDIRNASILEMLHSGNSAEQVSSYTGVDGRWLFRFEKMLFDHTIEQVNFSNIQVVVSQE